MDNQSNEQSSRGQEDFYNELTSVITYKIKRKCWENNKNKCTERKQFCEIKIM